MTEREALKLALETAEGIVKSDWRKWQELASPDEFERWVKSRALHMATAIKEALAQQDVQDEIDRGAKTLRETYLAQPEQEPVAYTGNGTAGREADVRPTGFFFQADKRQPEQKPVGEVYGWHGVGVGQPLCRFNVTESDMPVGSLLYTTPPQRKPLTDEQIDALPWTKAYKNDVTLYEALRDFARAIESKLKEKNT